MAGFQNFPADLSAPFVHHATITPSNTDDLPQSVRGIIVTTGGTLKITTVGGEVVTLPASHVVDGALIRTMVKKVWDTGTTASGLIGGW